MQSNTWLQRVWRKYTLFWLLEEVGEGGERREERGVHVYVTELRSIKFVSVYYLTCYMPVLWCHQEKRWRCSFSWHLEPLTGVGPEHFAMLATVTIDLVFLSRLALDRYSLTVACWWSLMSCLGSKMGVRDFVNTSLPSGFWGQGVRVRLSFGEYLMQPKCSYWTE